MSPSFMGLRGTGERGPGDASEIHLSTVADETTQEAGARTACLLRCGTGNGYCDWVCALAWYQPDVAKDHRIAVILQRDGKFFGSFGFAAARFVRDGIVPMD